MTPEAIEAVARAIYEECYRADPNFANRDDPTKREFMDYARAAIAAYQQAVEKDAVAWQSRFRLTNGDCTDWMTGRAVVYDGYLGSFEERPLFAAPPAPAIRVKALEWSKGVVDWAKPLPLMKYVACSTTPVGSWAWWLEGAEETRCVFSSEAEAKAAAQADYERRILSALEDAPAPAIPAGWKPISTAPKDGTEIIACNPSAGIDVMLVRFIAFSDFMDEYLVRTEIASGATEDDLNEPDWYFADFLEGGRLQEDCYPTHWLPLPEPPTQEASQ